MADQLPPPGAPPPAGTPLATDGAGNVVTGDGIPQPGQRTMDAIWLVIIGVFAAICLLLTLSLVWEFVASGGRTVDVATLKELFLFSGGFLTGVLARHLAH